VSDSSILDAAELEAIQAAMRESAPARRGPANEALPEPSRVALIAGDRDAEHARPILLALVNRWLRPLTRALQAYVPGEWRVDAVSADVVDGADVRDEVRGGWLAAQAVPNGDIVVAVRGAVVELAAARRLGDAGGSTRSSGTGTALALRLFAPTGRAVVDTLLGTWKDATGIAPESLAKPDGALERLTDDTVLVRATVAMTGDVGGQIVIYAPPAAVLPRPAQIAAIAADRAAIANALGHVPVELHVELGHLRLGLAQLRALKPGETFTLPNFVDTPVPLYCGGVIKAFGKPVIARGVLAIEVTTVVTAPGGKRS
jgi:flagellar motor switch/type III secretory pathway protein FliN